MGVAVGGMRVEVLVGTTTVFVAAGGWGVADGAGWSIVALGMGVWVDAVATAPAVGELCRNVFIVEQPMVTPKASSRRAVIPSAQAGLRLPGETIDLYPASLFVIVSPKETRIPTRISLTTRMHIPYRKIRRVASDEYHLFEGWVQSGDQAIRQSGNGGKEHRSQQGNQAIRQSGDQAIRRSGDQAIRRSGDQAIRQWRWRSS